MYHKVNFLVIICCQEKIGRVHPNVILIGIPMLVAYCSGTGSELYPHYMLKEYISLYHVLLCPLPARLFFVWKAILFVTVLFCLLASSLCFSTKGLGLTNLFLFFSPLCPSPSPRMKVWRRSAWPVQVAFLVALVMLCVDPVSAGSRNHRGQTGTPRSWSEPFFQHLQRLITLSLRRYSTCSRVTPILEEQEEERGGGYLLCPSVWHNETRPHLGFDAKHTPVLNDRARLDTNGT